MKIDVFKIEMSAHDDVRELKKLIDQLGSGMELYLTGTSRCEELWPYVDEVTEMTTPYRRTSDSHFCEED